MDYKLDESYTPARVSVRAGSGLADLRELRAVDLVEPQGWVVVPLTPPGRPE
jgi:anaphase-promoting complex subunit 10